MAAVTPIAKAPQKLTRAIAFQIFAPPVFALTAPSDARKHKEAIETPEMSQENGTTAAVARGSAAPTEKVAADVSAA